MSTKDPLTKLMKAIVYHDYGSSDALRLEEVEKPVPKDNEKAIVMSLFGNKKAIVFVAKANPDDLTFLSDLIVAGKLTPVIDRCYGLNEAAEAMRYLEAGHARGKLIVTMSGD